MNYWVQFRLEAVFYFYEKNRRRGGLVGGTSSVVVVVVVVEVVGFGDRRLCVMLDFERFENFFEAFFESLLFSVFVVGLEEARKDESVNKQKEENVRNIA